MEWKYHWHRVTRRAPKPRPYIAPIEEQLDIMIHATQIVERFPFTKVRS